MLSSPWVYIQFVQFESKETLIGCFLDLVIHGNERFLRSCYTVAIPCRQGALLFILIQI